ncbi:hypothetical protein DP107_01630 [Haloglomus irregulare]|jgi:hypothetical protein|uniref:Uncharacterized protein n=1 Tax=Haloglomus irregulare TaxID=2234134 RepID=A0A554NEY6_9EURY|nr:hypothetical protein [Haloglomus irregulare]TSD15908.1 hypothetical protein DP107_01630 [Haloglomus irregulare]
MRLRSLFGAVVSYALLLLAVAGIGGALWFSARIALAGARVSGLLFSVGLVVLGGFLGWAVRMAVGGNLLPADVDPTTVFRGGQGGL